jgi:diguanylate cyclase (GGDEF)-like protein
VAIVMLDIDHFKAFNDRYGHPAGDACIKRVTACALAELRGAEDLAARYGGEELLLVLPDAAIGVAVAERIRRGIEALGLSRADPDRRRALRLTDGLKVGGQAFPKFSKEIPTLSKHFQAFSKEIPSFSKTFPW